MNKLPSFLSIIISMLIIFKLTDFGFSQTLPLITSGELSAGKSAAFAGGSACCGCKIDHYGQLPADFPNGKISSVTFYLRGSRSNSYYTKIANGPNKLKLILGSRESFANSQKATTGAILPIDVPWFITFSFTPAAPVNPAMTWKLLDGDNNKYSAVLLHSSDVDLKNGL